MTLNKSQCNTFLFSNHDVPTRWTLSECAKIICSFMSVPLLDTSVEWKLKSILFFNVLRTLFCYVNFSNFHIKYKFDKVRFFFSEPKMDVHLNMWQLV
jgi:hypothetical protein